MKFKMTSFAAYDAVNFFLIDKLKQNFRREPRYNLVKIEMCMSLGLEIPFLGLHPSETLTHTHTNICTRIFAKMFVMMKNGNPLVCPSLKK